MRVGLGAAFCVLLLGPGCEALGVFGSRAHLETDTAGSVLPDGPRVSMMVDGVAWETSEGNWSNGIPTYIQSQVFVGPAHSQNLNMEIPREVLTPGEYEVTRLRYEERVGPNSEVPNSWYDTYGPTLVVLAVTEDRLWAEMEGPITLEGYESTEGTLVISDLVVEGWGHF